MNSAAQDTEDSDSVTDLVGWLADLAARIDDAGHVVITRPLAGPALAGSIGYTGVGDVEDFLEDLARLAPRVVHAGLVFWDGDDSRALHDELRTARRRARTPFPAPSDIDLIARVTAQEGEAVEGVVAAVVDGVRYVLTVTASWYDGVEAALAAASRPAEADDEDDDEDDSAWLAERAAREADRLKVVEVLDGLAAVLQDDEAFLTGAGRSDATRRAYAQTLVRERSGVNDVPPDLRGQVSAAAEAAWQWWRVTGRPARTAALREKAVELAHHPELHGTLNQRRIVARRLLTAIDAPALTTDLVEELARGF